MVTFCGGEPLLLRKIGEYAATLRQCGKSTVLNTNGELLRRRLDQGLRLADFALVGISVEGSTPDVHHAMRGDKADLDEVMEAARLVTKEPGVSLKLATVVSRVKTGTTCRNWPGPSVTSPRTSGGFTSTTAGVTRTPGSSGIRSQTRSSGAWSGRPRPWPHRYLVAPSTEAETEGCLIVDPAGNVLQPVGDRYLRRGNCLEEPLDQIWAEIPARSTIINNKRWLSVLS